MSDDNAVMLHKGQAMGQSGIGYGHQPSTGGGRKVGYASGGKVKHAGMHNMHGGLTKKGHTENHKSHGHHHGVVHHKTGGVHHNQAFGVGGGGASTGKHQSACTGPSDTQFGSGEPSTHGSTLGKW
jgi:hypothetical protein